MRDLGTRWLCPPTSGRDDDGCGHGRGRRFRPSRHRRWGRLAARSNAHSLSRTSPGRSRRKLDRSSSGFRDGRPADRTGPRLRGTLGERGALPDWRQGGPRDGDARRGGASDRGDPAAAGGFRSRGTRDRRVTADRAERSVLATPGSNPRMIAKALASDADLVMLDLEDAVTPDAKAAARSTVAEVLRDGDWRGRPRAFRMNALDTPWFVRDLVEVIEGAQGQVDRIVVPKVGRPEDVHTVATILASLKVAAGAQQPIALETQIESAAGLAHCEAIAT